MGDHEHGHAVAGQLIWNAIFVYGGYALGERFHVVSEYADVFSNIVLVLILAFLAIWVVLRLRRDARRRNDPDWRPPTADEMAARVEAILESSDHRK